MVVAADNMLLGVIVAAACLCLVLMGRAGGQRTKLIWGGIAVAAGMAALALLADALTRGS